MDRFGQNLGTVNERGKPTLNFIGGVNCVSLLAVATILGMVVTIMAAISQWTAVPLDAILIASQILCGLLAAGSMMVATFVFKRMVKVMEMKEVEARLKDVKKLSAIEWKPGMVLWVKINERGLRRDSAEAYLQEVRKDMLSLGESLGLDDPPILVTASDVSLNTLSVIDLLAVLGRTTQADDDDEEA